MTPSPSRNPTRWRWISGAVAALALLVGWVEGVPRLAEARAVLASWVEAQSRLEEAEDAPARQMLLRTERNRLETRLVSLPGTGPMTTRSALASVQAAARDAGVEVAALEPGDAVRDDELERLPVRLVVRGSYDGVGRFVTALETPTTDAVPLRVLGAAVRWSGATAGREVPLIAELDVEALRVVRRDRTPTR